MQDDILALHQAYNVILEPDDNIYKFACDGDMAAVREAKENGDVPIGIDAKMYFHKERQLYPMLSWNVLLRVFSDTMNWTEHLVNTLSNTRRHSKFPHVRKQTRATHGAKEKLQKELQRAGVQHLTKPLIAKLAMFAYTVDDLMFLQTFIPLLKQILVDAAFWVHKLRTDMLRFQDRLDKANKAKYDTFWQTHYGDFYAKLPGYNTQPRRNSLISRRIRQRYQENEQHMEPYRVLFACSIPNVTWWKQRYRDNQMYRWQNMYWLIYADSILTCLLGDCYQALKPSSKPTFNQPCPYRMAWSTLAEAMPDYAYTGVPLIDDFLKALPYVQFKTEPVVDTEKLRNGTDMLLLLNKVFMKYLHQKSNKTRNLRLPASYLV